jgi:threonine/homoserine/homoserine lactone efflux protein
MIEAFLKGLAISLLLIFSVGPVIFMVIKQSVNHGKKGGFSFVGGVWISDLLWIILSISFSEVIKILMDFKVPIGIAGCCLLIGMGVYFAFFKKVMPRKLQEPLEIAGDEITPTGKKKTNYFAILSSGFVINTLNPAVISFWVLMAASLSELNYKQKIVAFATCLIINMLADSGKVLGAGLLGKKLSDENILRINKLSGFLYLGFGISLLAGIIISILKH